ncbi:uncharacterized mitochondrial protein-like protein [Tanacetum coccineum]
MILMFHGGKLIWLITAAEVNGGCDVTGEWWMVTGGCDWFHTTGFVDKRVFPNFYILGWYSTRADAEKSDMQIHKVLMDINESPVYLLLNPLINHAQKDLRWLLVCGPSGSFHVVNGSWTAKSRNMCNWCNVAMDLKEKFLSFEICHVKREYDNEADNQANMAVDLDSVRSNSSNKKLQQKLNYGEKLQRYTMNKYVEAALNSATVVLPYLVPQKKDGVFISQDKYVVEILKKFGFTDVKTASTPMETQKPLLKDEDGEEVDVHMYRLMIGSLMYLTSSRPDIMFTVCACARYQVNQKVSHLYALKSIFRYLKGQPKLGLWYLKDSPFDLVAYTDSDYVGASLDRKSIAGGDYVDRKSTSGICTFMGCCLTSWFSKKQTALAISTTEAEYVSAKKACQQALWMKQALVDYDIHLETFL